MRSNSPASRLSRRSQPRLGYLSPVAATSASSRLRQPYSSYLGCLGRFAQSTRTMRSSSTSSSISSTSCPSRRPSASSRWSSTGACSARKTCRSMTFEPSRTAASRRLSLRRAMTLYSLTRCGPTRTTATALSPRRAAAGSRSSLGATLTTVIHCLLWWRLLTAAYAN